MKIETIQKKLKEITKEAKKNNLFIINMKFQNFKEKGFEFTFTNETIFTTYEAFIEKLSYMLLADYSLDEKFKELAYKEYRIDTYKKGFFDKDYNFKQSFKIEFKGKGE